MRPYFVSLLVFTMACSDYEVTAIAPETWPARAAPPVLPDSKPKMIV